MKRAVDDELRLDNKLHGFLEESYYDEKTIGRH